MLTRNRVKKHLAGNDGAESSTGSFSAQTKKKAKSVDIEGWLFVCRSTKMRLFLCADAGNEGKSSVWFPPYWEQQLDHIKQMRAGNNAPVDTIGAASLYEESADPAVGFSVFCLCTEKLFQTKRFQVLISLMLSSQTKDEVTAEAMRKLKEFGCTAEKLAATEEAKIGELIYPASFYKVFQSSL